MNNYSNEINKFIQENYGKMTYKEMADKLNEMYGTNLQTQSVKKRYHRNKDKQVDVMMDDKNTKPKHEYERFLPNGEKELLKVIFLTAEQKQSPEAVLKVLGYDADHWTMQDLIINTWQQNSNEKGITDLYQVKVRLKPLVKKLDFKTVIKATQETMKEIITPRVVKDNKTSKELNDNKLFEVPGIELHLGKMAHNWDTGEDYDQKIAQERFEDIVENIIVEQRTQKCGTCFLSIGQDFFNSDTVDNLTTRGTPQQNDLRWKKMFKIGLELYIEAILTMREEFNKVDVQLCQGNHDVMASFYLYIALQQYFINDKKVRFSDNYRTTQCYSFGKCAIFTNHGDGGKAFYNRLVETLAVEFPQEWAKATFRELHMGHLHSEFVEEKAGLVTRRIGSPSGTDDWHYQQRYLGATQKHQLFIWDKEKGLLNIKYINFLKKKQKTKTLTR